MIRWALILCALTAVVGCGHSDRLGTTGNPPPRANPDVPAVPAPSSEWAATLKRCGSLLGKSKDDLVAAIGPPASTFTLGDQDRYDYNRNGYRMSLTFIDKQGLSNVGLAFDGVTPSAREVWEALNGPGTKPSTFRLDEKQIASFWGGGTPYDHPAVALNGPLAGTVLRVNGRMTVPILKQEKRFDTKENGYVLGPLIPNPNADWRSVQVESVDVNRHDDGLFVRLFGPAHPIFQNGG